MWNKYIFVSENSGSLSIVKYFVMTSGKGRDVYCMHKRKNESHRVTYLNTENQHSYTYNKHAQGKPKG